MVKIRRHIGRGAARTHAYTHTHAHTHTTVLNRLFEFTSKICPVPVFMSLLVAVVQKDKEIAKEEEGRKKDLRAKWQKATQSVILSNTKGFVPTIAKFALFATQGSEESILPMDINQLYRMAIQQVLRKWNAKMATVAETVMSRISLHNVYWRDNARVFEEQHVQAALVSDEERACWDAIIETWKKDENAVPLIKVLEMRVNGGKYQFKHLSFQEYLGGYESWNNHQRAENGAMTASKRFTFGQRVLVNRAGKGDWIPAIISKCIPNDSGKSPLYEVTYYEERNVEAAISAGRIRSLSTAPVSAAFMALYAYPHKPEDSNVSLGTVNGIFPQNRQLTRQPQRILMSLTSFARRCHDTQS